jgi:multidrug resistance efflux pump
MKPGDRVLFIVDAYGRVYRGNVTGIGGASGSRLSLLPPENATGNFVKVVQRIPFTAASSKIRRFTPAVRRPARVNDFETLRHGV